MEAGESVIPGYHGSNKVGPFVKQPVQVEYQARIWDIQVQIPSLSLKVSGVALGLLILSQLHLPQRLVVVFTIK